MSLHEHSAPRVMLATDDSAAARAAEDWVCRMRWSAPPVVEVVCVAGSGLAGLGWGMQTYREPVRQAVEGLRMSELLAAQRVSNEVGERLQRAGLTVRTWARQGRCDEELLAMAASEFPDLVVLGPRGRSGLAAAILGSVTQQIATRVAAPILVARPALAEQGRLPQHVLVPVDAIPSGELVVGWLVRSGWVEDARITLLGLIGEPVGLDDAPPGRDEDIARLVRADVTEALERLAAPLIGHAGVVNLLARAGHPLEAALGTIEEVDADLVAIAGPSPGPGRGSLAGKVGRHAPISALLVPLE